MGLSEMVLGLHPNNTVCSFNWHNVRHITAFLARVASELRDGGLTVVDVGCGRSPYFPLFASKCADYIAIDLAESLPADEDRPIRQLVGHAESLPLPSEVVDVVLCNQVLEHVQDVDASIREAYRVLKPGGTYFGSIPHVSPIHLEPHDYRRLTALGIEKHLVGSGFEVAEIEGNGGVFAAAALMISMDLLLSRRLPGKPQAFHSRTAVLVAPLVGLLNLSALVADRIFGNRLRTPSNLCWSARKPADSF